MVDITFCTFEYKLFEFFWEKLDNENAYSTVQKKNWCSSQFFGALFLKFIKILSEMIFVMKMNEFSKGLLF